MNPILLIELQLLMMMARVKCRGEKETRVVIKDYLSLTLASIVIKAFHLHLLHCYHLLVLDDLLTVALVQMVLVLDHPCP